MQSRSSLCFVLAVLKRDGTNVVTDSSCKATSGNWVSPYDNVATTLASDLDIVSQNFVPRSVSSVIIDKDVGILIGPLGSSQGGTLYFS